MLKNIMTLMTGTIGAQMIALAITPFVTRLYGPVEFGLLGLFLAIMIVFGPISALTFPAAIVLPKKESEAKAIVFLSIITSAIISALVLIVFVFFNDSILSMFKLEGLGGAVLLIPIGMFFMSCQQICEQWLVRNKEFLALSKVTIIQSIILNGSKVVGGIFLPYGMVLITLTASGYFIHSILLYLSSSKKIHRGSEGKDKVSLRAMAKKYSDFPIFRAPQTFLNLSSQGIPVLMLAGSFGPATAGFYTLARTIMALPTNLIGKAIGDVFYPRISEAAAKSDPIFGVFSKATISLVVVGLLPYAFVFVFGGDVFSFIFGDDWFEAGLYAAWLSIWIYTMFITSVCSNTLAVINGQKFNLIFTVIKVFFRILSIYGCLYFEYGAVKTVALFSVISAVINIVFMIFVFQLVREYDRNK
jgi:O-antigen/teichoic acid export membrane protein